MFNQIWIKLVCVSNSHLFHLLLLSIDQTTGVLYISHTYCTHFTRLPIISTLQCFQQSDNIFLHSYYNLQQVHFMTSLRRLSNRHNITYWHQTNSMVRPVLKVNGQKHQSVACVTNNTLGKVKFYVVLLRGMNIDKQFNSNYFTQMDHNYTFSYIIIFYCNFS